MNGNICGTIIRTLRLSMDLTQLDFVKLMPSEHQRPSEGLRYRELESRKINLSDCEIGRRVPSKDFSQKVCDVLREQGINETTITDLLESIKLDRLRREEKRLAAKYGLSIIDSQHLARTIENEYQILLDEQLSSASQWRVTENLLLYIKHCPELIPIGWQETIITRFLALRVDAVNDIGRRMFSGEGLNPDQLDRYYDPPMTPQVSLLAPFKAVEDSQVDFGALPEETKTIGHRALLQGLETGDWAKKTEFAFLLRHFDHFVPEDGRSQIADRFTDLLGAKEAQENPWVAWPCLKGALKFTDLNTPLYRDLIQKANKHPAELIRLGANLLTPSRHIIDVLMEVTDGILESDDSLTCNEHVFVYYLYELCVLLPQIVSQTQTPLPRRLLSSIAQGIASRPDWRVAPRVEKTLFTIVTPYLQEA